MERSQRQNVSTWSRPSHLTSKAVSSRPTRTFFTRSVQETRAEELVKRSSMMKQLTGVVVFTNCSSNCLVLTTFVTLIIVDKLSRIQSLRSQHSLHHPHHFWYPASAHLSLGQQWASLLQAWASMKRIQDFLDAEDRPETRDAVDAGVAANAAAVASTNPEDSSVGYAARFEGQI